MHQLEFTSRDPLDHLPRALDIVRKMGFDLRHARVGPTADGGVQVSIVVEGGGSRPLSTLEARILALEGIAHCQASPLLLEETVE